MRSLALGGDGETMHTTAVTVTERVAPGDRRRQARLAADSGSPASLSVVEFIFQRCLFAASSGQQLQRTQFCKS